MCDYFLDSDWENSTEICSFNFFIKYTSVLKACLIPFCFMPFYCKLKGENEAVLCQADVLTNEEEEQQEVPQPQVPCISENMLCEQSR